MPLDSKLTEEQLFYSLIASLEHSVWVSLGKVKNPANDKIERNLYAASMNTFLSPTSSKEPSQR